MVGSGEVRRRRAEERTDRRRSVWEKASSRKVEVRRRMNSGETVAMDGRLRARGEESRSVVVKMVIYCES